MGSRNIEKLKTETFDLLVVGGGIQGACIAWEGTQRGLKVALIEKNDFCSATSANSLKILHGGLRYLQHLDFRRVGESIRSRRYFASFAPELVAPLPCVIPTQRKGLKHPFFMGCALLLNDVISCKRNKGLDSCVHLPNGKILSTQSCSELFPGLNESFPMGGARWYDYVIKDSERLTFELIKAATQQGAVVANYLEAKSIGTEDGQVRLVTAMDRCDPENEQGESFNIRCNAVVSSVGPWWNEQPLPERGKVGVYSHLRFAKAINIVLQEPLLGDHAIGMEAEDPNDTGKKRFFFLVPWQGGTMIGTTYAPQEEASPDGLKVTEAEIAEILNALQQWFPKRELRPDSVVQSHVGLLPVDIRQDKKGAGYKLHGDTVIQPYGATGEASIRNLFSIKTVKYTTSPIVAQHFFSKYGKSLGVKNEGTTLDTENRKPLVQILKEYIGEDGMLSDDGVRYFCHHEKVMRLSDLVVRRGLYNRASKPSLSVLRSLCRSMARELNWSPSREEKEISLTVQFYRDRGVELS